jgi:hypothetical protein
MIYPRGPTHGSDTSDYCHIFLACMEISIERLEVISIHYFCKFERTKMCHCHFELKHAAPNIGRIRRLKLGFVILKICMTEKQSHIAMCIESCDIKIVCVPLD